MRGELEAELRGLLQRGDKLAALGLLRSQRGLSVSEAREYVSGLARDSARERRLGRAARARRA